MAEDVARLHLPFDGRHRTIHDAQGNALEVRGFSIPELRIGTVILRDVRGWEARHAPNWEPPVHAGHIGRGLLSAFRVTIDVPSRSLHLDSARCAEPAAKTRVAAEFDSDGVTSQAVADDARLTMIWDTAATVSIVRTERASSIGPRDHDDTSLMRPKAFTVGGLTRSLRARRDAH